MKARFEVSTEGMRELQSGREPWQLAKELVANAWDETATKCEVTIKSITSRQAVLTVYDDGGGFSKIEDAWTLMGHTSKRGDPTVRGRFNIGEKEILSVATEASIFTSGKIIRFPKTGGRQVRTDPNPIKGTKIVCKLPWGYKQVNTVTNKLSEMLTPKGFEYIVNGKTIPYYEPDDITEAILETVLQKSPLEPVRSTFRRASIEIYNNGSDKGMLFEMGIPIQKIACPFKVNVMQKVPMPPNRDVVKDSYLEDIYAAVLNCKIDDIAEFSDSWIRMAIESGDTNSEVIKSVMSKRYGDKVMLWSTNTIANERAMEHGFEIIHGKTLSEPERKAFEKIGLQHTSDVFAPMPEAGETIPYEQWTDGMKKTGRYAQYLGKKLLSREIGIQMYILKGDIANATWCNGVISFNVNNLGKSFFDKITPRTTSLILHELAHQRGNGHDHLYLDSLKELAGEAVHLAINKSYEFFEFGIY